MNKFFRMAAYFVAGLMMTTGMAACDDDDDENGTFTEKEIALQKALVPYVNNTVIATYKNMADHAILLSKACDAMKEAHAQQHLTTAMVEEACKEWKLSRHHWEQSEAFLFGAAGDYNIDPHIDSWPLDKAKLVELLDEINKGKEVVIDNVGYGLLGYHALEYMLFELSADGEKSLTHSTEYTEAELIYTCAVAEDLRNQCVRLEAAWAGLDNVSDEKAKYLEDAELEPTINYGKSMINAGKGGSLYKNYQDAAEELMQGAMDICDEVGTLKIGNPFRGGSEEEKNYIESPYSLNSITDFQDNIKSIKHAYCGSKEGDASLSDYIKSVNPKLDADVIAKIDVAIATIAKMPEPFAKHASEKTSENAIKSLEELMGALEQVAEQLTK